ncbi:MAG: glycine--tRNA ligase subunit beta [Terriglobales bacterium]
MPDTAPLLVEIGCEELPARMVASLAQAFSANLNQRLQVVQLGRGEAAWTPRRLVFYAPEVQLRQPEGEEEVVGPPARVAYKPDGSLSPQGVGFAAKNQVPADAVYRLSNAKGEYVAVRRKSGGAAAADLLLELIPQALAAVPLSRSMRWADGARFVRPVRWLLALHGSEAIPFSWSGLKAAAESRGHRALGQARFAVAAASDYPALWTKNFVMVSPVERSAAIAEAAGPRHRPDPDLFDTLVNLTEWPSGIVGDFDPVYLKSLPSEVLVTVMRNHQKYLALDDGNGSLAPQFVAVLNQADDPQGLIRHGNERVLRARFRDAQFFFDIDRKQQLMDRLPRLDGVTFQVKLGSYGDKARRMQAMAAGMGGNEAAEQAALLAKCDLTTEMVKEFPELQGVMGGHYARAEGLPEVVAQAIADQYLFDAAPHSIEGAVVALADKLDTVAGMFALGEIPTGSADPFALRRQGNSIIRTLIERQMPFKLRAAIEQALAGYGAHADFRSADEVCQAAAAFFKERLSFYLREVLGASANAAAAVLAAGSDDPLDAARRYEALFQAPDLSAVAAVVKRARSIVRKEGGLEQWLAQPPNLALLREEAEIGLRVAVDGLNESDEDYNAELQAIAALALPLERFFNEVQVNDPDPALRASRLGLLAATVARLNRIADFAELAVV